MHKLLPVFLPCAILAVKGVSIMATTVKNKRETKATANPKTAARLNPQPATRKPKNRFIGATEDETDQRIFAYNRFLGTLSDEEMDRELDKLNRSELHLLAWITTYYSHQKRLKEEKKKKKKGSKK